MHIDSFTPFGYLQNPYYQCVTNYWDVQSGVLRSDPKIVGFGWVLPFSKRPQWEVSIGLGLRLGSKLLLTRDELSVFDVDAIVHTPFRFVYRIDVGFRAFYAEFFLEDRGLLACRISQDGPMPIGRDVTAVGTAPSARRDAEAGEGAGEQAWEGGTAVAGDDGAAAAAEAAGAGDNREFGTYFEGARPVIVARAWSSDGEIGTSLDGTAPEGTAPEGGAPGGGGVWRVERPAHPKCKTPPVEVLYAGRAAQPAAAGATGGEPGRGGLDRRDAGGVDAPHADVSGGTPRAPEGGREAWLVVEEPDPVARVRLGAHEHPVAVAGWPAPIADRPPTSVAGDGAAGTADNRARADDSFRPTGGISAAQAARTAAARFVATVPRLTGDFPSEVKRGFYYDFETTRACTLPPAGVFRGHWPTWMINMPRVVLAEGSMDMARLAYSDPRLAKEAILTMLRDTPLENTPCVFASGEYNMVAADGARCGTSPAWCIPFVNIYDIYRRVGDPAWLEAIYPHLVSLVDYWLKKRTDPEGWLTYKCTWEAGEDNNPRIDPMATGDNVISDYVRPVELQASMAHAASILGEFAETLGRGDDVARFESIHDEFREKTQALWDSEAGRFRDWDRLAGAFVQVAGEESYWGADFTRQSPLSLIALLLDTAKPEQRLAMRREVAAFFRSPFTIWPSWSTFVLEAAAATGVFDMAGEMAWEIVRRTAATSDRRSLGAIGGTVGRPTPGAAPEYWPYDPKEFMGNDAYAWGAQSAAFVVRHVLGIRPVYGLGTNGGAGTGGGLRLRPAFPPGLRLGGEYGVENLAHGAGRISVSYSRIAGYWMCRVGIEEVTGLEVRCGDEVIYQGGPSSVHEFSLPERDGVLQEVTLI